MWKIFFFVLIAVSVEGLAQPLPANSINAGTGQNVTDHELILESKRALGLTDEVIEGSPYMDSEFKPATIITRRGTYHNVPVRYNAHADNLEYRQGTTTYIADASLNIQSVRFADHTMMVAKQPSGKALTFYEVLDSGRVTLLMRKPVVFKSAEAPKALEASGKPARYTNAPEEYYLMTGDQLPVQFSGVKKLVELLPDKQEEVKKFVSANKISKKSADLVRVVKHYNSF